MHADSLTREMGSHKTIMQNENVGHGLLMYFVLLKNLEKMRFGLRSRVIYKWANSRFQDRVDSVL